MKHKELLTEFMEMSKEGLWELFLGLNEDSLFMEDNFIYIPGEAPPENRILLVAHLDTVFDDEKRRVKWEGRIASSGFSGKGIGADDRAGCAALWLMRESGMPMLLTDFEEKGCIGAREAARQIPETLRKSLFAVQMDRRGDQQAVFYSVASDEFQDWIVEVLGEGWKKYYGSFSDIGAVCGPKEGEEEKELKAFNGVNLSAGYLHEHQSNEILLYDAWERSVEAMDFLCQLALDGDVPELPGPEKKLLGAGWAGRHYSTQHQGCSFGYFEDGEWKWFDEEEEEEEDSWTVLDYSAMLFPDLESLSQEEMSDIFEDIWDSGKVEGMCWNKNRLPESPDFFFHYVNQCPNLDVDVIVHWHQTCVMNNDTSDPRVQAWFQAVQGELLDREAGEEDVPWETRA